MFLNDNSTLNYTPLSKYLMTDFQSEIQAMSKNKKSSALANIDEILLGGFDTGVYILSGEYIDLNNSLLLHLAEKFCLEKTAVIYYSIFESYSSIMQKMITRHLFKKERDESLSLYSVQQHLVSDDKFLQSQQKELFNLTKYFGVEQGIEYNSEILRKRLILQKSKYSDFVLFLDLPNKINNETINNLITLANELEITIILNTTSKPFLKISSFPEWFDKLSLLNIEQCPSSEIPFYSPHAFSALIKLSVESIGLPIKYQETQLNYFPKHFYLQDA